MGCQIDDTEQEQMQLTMEGNEAYIEADVSMSGHRAF